MNWDEENAHRLAQKEEAENRSKAYKQLSEPKFVEKYWFAIMLLSGFLNSGLGWIANNNWSLSKQKKQSTVDTVFVVNQTKHDTVYIYSRTKKK